MVLSAVCLFFGSLCYSCGAEPGSTVAWAKLASLRAPMPETTVLNGCELIIGGVRCRLLGVKLTENAEERANAKRFLERYLKNYGAYFSIYNDQSPVSSEDGTPLVWLRGHGNGGWAQETLVQAGLVAVDLSGMEEYRFQTHRKSGREEFDWKRCLREAEASHRSGAKPNVNFDWP